MDQKNFIVAIVLSVLIIMAAEFGLFGPQFGERPALGGVDQAGRHDEAAGGQSVAVDHLDILAQAAHFFYPQSA